MTDGIIKSRWTKLDSQRGALLTRVRECSRLTLPFLFPPSSSTTTEVTLPTPYQGLGARGVNNITAKLMLALLPPNTPFFRLQLDEMTMADIQGGENAEQSMASFEDALAKIERTVQAKIESDALRVPVYGAIRYAAISGNALLYLPDDAGAKVYRLDQYVIKRDPMGKVIEIIIKEMVHPKALEEAVYTLVAPAAGADGADSTDEDTPWEMYTHVKWKQADKKWYVTQEINGVEVTSARGDYPADETPYLPLRWTAIPNEDYGRGIVEEFLGDFISLEEMTKALVESAMIAAKVVFLANPNGSVRMTALVNAANGQVIEGVEGDVSTVQVQKFYDFKITLEAVTRIESRLSYAFLLMTSVRDAERVTAEEIRAVTKELEDALGGVYSVLAQELQLPLIKRVLKRLQKAKKLPDLPEELVTPVVTTGVDALGRGNDLAKLITLVAQIRELGPEIVTSYLNMPEFIARITTAIGINSDGLIKSQEQVQEEQKQAQMSAAMAAATPGVAQEAVKAGAMAAQPAEGAPA